MTYENPNFHANERVLDEKLEKNVVKDESQEVIKKGKEALFQTQTEMGRLVVELINISEMRGFTGISREAAYTLSTLNSSLTEAIEQSGNLDEENLKQLLLKMTQAVNSLVTKIGTREINTDIQQYYKRILVGKSIAKIMYELDKSKVLIYQSKPLIAALDNFSRTNASVSDGLARYLGIRR